MELLDLQSHDPDEFEGKEVVHEGGHYEVGPFLGHGGSKIVHSLINRTSGLVLHVMKIWRSNEIANDGGPRELAAKHLANALGFEDLVPELQEVSSHGGRFELQPFFGQPPDDAATSLLERGMEARRMSRPAVAEDLFQKVLEINPSHTEAHWALALVKASRNDWGGAFLSAASAISIEPNILRYHQAYVEFAAGAGRIGTAARGYDTLASRYPYDNALLDLGARVFLAAGAPERADALAKTNFPKGGVSAQTVAAIAADREAKQRAAPFVRQAKDALLGQTGAAVLPLLARAVGEYSKDAYVNVTLGLHLLGAGDGARAKDLLLRATSVLPTGLQGFCYFNAARAAAKTAELSLAVRLLEGLSQVLFLDYGDQGPDPVRLPSIGFWLDREGTIEAGAIEAFEFIEELLGAAKEVKVSEEVARIREWYRKAAATVLV